MNKMWLFEIGVLIQGKTEVLGPSVTLSTTKPTRLSAVSFIQWYVPITSPVRYCVVLDVLALYEKYPGFDSFAAE